MQYWKIVDAGNHVMYGVKLIQLFYTNKDYFFEHQNQFWNPVRHERMNEVLTQIPEFEDVKSKFGRIKEMALLILYTDSSTLHVDHTSGMNKNVLARLNIPVMNCNDSQTAFFELEESVYKEHTLTSGGTKYWSNDIRNNTKPITSVELSQPTILRTSTPHTVFCKDCKFPRISLTISFEDDIVRHLDE